jgi:hypothetical protein
MRAIVDGTVGTRVLEAFRSARCGFSQLPAIYINQPTVLISSECYYMAVTTVTTTVLMKRMATWLEGNVWKYTVDGSETAQWRCGWGRSVGHISTASV